MREPSMRGCLKKFLAKTRRGSRREPGVVVGEACIDPPCGYSLVARWTARPGDGLKRGAAPGRQRRTTPASPGPVPAPGASRRYCTGYLAEKPNRGAWPPRDEPDTAPTRT